MSLGRYAKILIGENTLAFNKYLFIFSFLLIFNARAKQDVKQGDTDFAHCTKANKQLKQLNGFFPTEARVQAAKLIMQDMNLLRPHLEKNKTGLPDKLIKVCYAVKRQSFESVFTKGTEDLFGNFDFLMTAGNFFFYEREWQAAYNVFEAAAKLQPSLLNPNHYALQAWIMLQLTTEKPVTNEIFMQVCRKYISSMLKVRDLSEVNRKYINQYLGIIEEMANKVYTARKMKENAVALDPQNLKLRLSWGEFEERNGQFEAALRVYAAAVDVKTTDKETLREIYFRSLNLLKRTKSNEQLKKQLKKALALFPRDKSFNDFKEVGIPKSPATQRLPASAP